MNKKNYQKRYFVVKGSELQYYKKKSDLDDKKKPKSITLSSVTIKDGGLNGEKREFIITDAKKKKRFLAAEKASGEKWWNAISLIVTSNKGTIEQPDDKEMAPKGEKPKGEKNKPEKKDKEKVDEKKTDKKR